MSNSGRRLNFARLSASPWREIFQLDRPALLFSIFVCAAYFVIWWKTQLDPINANTLAWNGWWDQSQYLRSTTALSKLNFAPAEHWYPLGYSLLGLPFVWIFPSEPYLLPNLFLTELYALAFLALFRPVIGLLPTILVFSISLLVPWEVWDPHYIFSVSLQWIIPWNTIPIAAILLTSLLFVRYSARIELTRIDYLLGAFVAFGLVTRPSDVPVVAIATGASLVLRASKSRSPIQFVRSAIGFASVAVPVGILHFTIFHGIVTPYSAVSTDIGASISELPFRFYNIFVDSGATFGESSSIFMIQPWLIAALPLFAVWGFSDRRAGLVAFCCCGVSWVTYLAYNDFWPLNIFRYFLFHYITWTLPVVTAGGVAGAIVVWQARHRWVGLLAVAMPIVAILSTKIVATPISATISSNAARSFHIAFSGRRDVSAIDFHGVVVDGALGGSNEQATILVDGHALELFRSYRVFRMGGGIRVAFREPVAGTQIDIQLPASIENAGATPNSVVPIRFSGVLRVGLPPTDRDMPEAVPLEVGDKAINPLKAEAAAGPVRK